jgi:hypothetical protein
MPTGPAQQFSVALGETIYGKDYDIVIDQVTQGSPGPPYHDPVRDVDVPTITLRPALSVTYRGDATGNPADDIQFAYVSGLGYDIPQPAWSWQSGFPTLSPGHSAMIEPFWLTPTYDPGASIRVTESGQPPVDVRLG